MGWTSIYGVIFIQNCIQSSKGFTPYQLVYGLYPLMPTKYIVPFAGGNEKDSILVRVLISRIIELKKFQEAKMQAVETKGI